MGLLCPGPQDLAISWEGHPGIVLGLALSWTPDLAIPCEGHPGTWGGENQMVEDICLIDRFQLNCFIKPASTCGVQMVDPDIEAAW